MKIDAVTHFTDEIEVVEISTLRDNLTLIISDPMQVYLTSRVDGQTTVQLRRMPVPDSIGEAIEEILTEADKEADGG